MPVVCVDLDGTLVATDTLHETLLLAVKRRPALALRLPLWLWHGKAGFKRRLTGEALPDAALLPYRADVLEWLREQKAAGRKICLVTASDQRMADAVAAHLAPLFDEAWGSDGARNLGGRRKRDFLVERFGRRGYDYLGDSDADVAVWAQARQAIVVSSSERLERAARSVCDNVQRIAVPGLSLKTVVKALRVHQWVKNVLVFTVLITAFQFSAPALWYRAALAFCALSLCASSIYIINDLLDLESDRRHPKKRCRPFASGAMSIGAGLALLPVCLALAAAFGARLNAGGQILLCLYPIVSITYSLVLKRLALVDVFTLSLLYLIRILLGASVASIPCTQWLMAFSVFFFLSLAFTKRASELIALQQRHAAKASGRAYSVSDLSVVQIAGISSCFAAGLVLALYIQSAEVLRLYRQPQWLWFLAFGAVFWLLRVWLVASRGELNEDPVLFALRDRPSAALLAFIFAGLVLARIGTPAFPGLR